ncbi:MAG: polyprenyl synthetase family protein [bacterium]|nr:polyprenyl synthetase family protein [bacterium]
MMLTSEQLMVQAPATAGYDALLKHGLETVNQLMHTAVDSDVTVLRDASRHIIEAGGKRIRPRLMILSYLATDGSPAALNQVSAPAAAIELVHTASVVHDDINDHGVVRRGRPSVNALWGRTFALLTGDFLFTKVYELMAPYRDLNVPLADATVALVEGETLQAQAVKENNFNRETYYQIIGRKTAALFGAAAKIGAMMANAPQNQVDMLYQFGYNIGLAFQIVDDVLDLVGDEKQLGKTSGIDVAQGRGFATAYATETPETVDEADPMVSIKRRVLQGDALEEARRQSRALVEAAVRQLDILPDSPYKQGLIDTAHMVIDREF